MKNKEIEQAKKDLWDIKKMPPLEQYEPLNEWIKKYCVPVSFKYSLGKVDELWKKEAFENAHRFLQTEMMLNACISAKQSCKWAAVAAIVASIGVILGWYTYLFKTIMIMFKSIL